MISRRSTFKAALLAATAAGIGTSAWAADKVLKEYVANPRAIAAVA